MQSYIGDKIEVHNVGLSARDAIEIANTVFTQNFPKLEEMARKEVEKNRNIFLLELDSRINGKLNSEEISKFNNPRIQLALRDAMITASCNNDSANRIILSNLIIGRIKTDGNNFDEILYEEAIKIIPRITKNHIFILTFLEIIRSFLYTLVSDTVERTNLENLSEYLQADIQINNSDIEHCKSLGIITPNFPYEWNLEYLSKDSENKETPKIILNIREIFEKFRSLRFELITISPVGQIIANENIYNLLGYVLITKMAPLKPTDLEVNNLSAQGEVTAFNVALK